MFCRYGVSCQGTEYGTVAIEDNQTAEIINILVGFSSMRSKGCFWLNCNMPPFAVLKVMFQAVKGRVLHCKRWPFAMHWISVNYAAN